MTYAEIAKRLYGEDCEMCGWGKAPCDVHHIDYQDHRYFEEEMRKALEEKNMEKFDSLQQQALIKGFGLFNTDTKQLPKNNSTDNLAVLCPNCHREVHHYDLGKKILKNIPPRKKVDSKLLEAFKNKE